MSVYRRKYRKGGKVLVSRYWSVRFTGPNSELVRRTTKLLQKTHALAYEIQLRMDLEAGKAGIIDAEHGRAAFTSHIDGYAAWLESLGRDSMYIYTAKKRLLRLSREVGWRHLSDITLASFETWRTSLKRYPFHGKVIGPKTTNQYLDTARQFCDWCRKAGRIRRNPLDDAEHARAMPSANYRRAATADELTKLLKAVSGERRRFYLFTIYCPLRRKALKHLRWDDLHLNDSPAWGTLRPEINKTRIAERFPIRDEVAVELRQAKNKTGRVFKAVPTADEIRQDWEAAGVPFSDAKGQRRLDLHSFRRTAIELLRQAGVSLREAKELLHHKDERTTAKYYGERPDPVTIAAVEKLPTFG